MNIEEAYRNERSSWKSTTSCKVLDPDINITKVTEGEVDGEYILKSVWIEKWGIVITYGLENYNIISVTNNTIKPIANVTKPDEFENKAVFLFHFLDKVICSSGFDLYYFDGIEKALKDPNATVELKLWTTLPSNSQLEEDSLVKLISNGLNNIVIIDVNDYYVYIYDNSTEKFSLRPNKHAQSQLTMSKDGSIMGFFTDAIRDGNDIFLLNNALGVVHIENFHPELDVPAIIRQYQIGFSDDLIEFISVSKHKHVFEIVFLYQQESYVVEMYLNVEGNSRELVVNRFYDKMNDVSNIEFMDKELFMFGREEVQIFGIGINRHALNQYG